MRSSSIATILRASAQNPHPYRVGGAPPSARALLVARLVKLRGAPIVVLCQDDDTAAAFGADMATLSRVVDGEAPPVFNFPSWEQSPYSSVSLSIRTRLSRSATLSALAQNGETPLVIVTTVGAATQATLPPSFLKKYLRSLRPGDDTFPRDQLIEFLNNAGYLRSESVEDPGTFSLRGEIIDVFPPDRERPLRIEYFDALIERIREFDPSTQRTLPAGDEPPPQEFWICPAREVLINPETSPGLRERLKAFADNQGIPRSLRDPVLASVLPGVYAERSDAWAPFAYPECATLLDHLPESTRLVWNDSFGAQQAWETYQQEQLTRFETATKNGLIVPSPDCLFLKTERWNQRVTEKAILFLDQIELLDSKSPEQEPLKVFVQDNHDLARGTKHSLGELEAQFRQWLKEGFRIVGVASTESQRERIRYLLEERGIPCSEQSAKGAVTLISGSLSAGFRWPSEGLIVLTDDEILGSRHARRPKGEHPHPGGRKSWSGLAALSDLSAGDAIVHVDHGIGRYRGLVRLDLSGAPSDFLLLEYANRDRLYLPVYRLNVIQKYAGSGETAPLDRLGTQQFAKTKEKVREGVKLLAVDLVRLYAERKIRPGNRFSPRDSLFREFEARFPFEETPDQLRSVDEILADLGSGRVMDRLVCGDVGYGKTEVAIRAAFRAVTDGKQVAVLVPTTVLSYQHEQSFRSRLSEYPMIIESVSRFKNAKQQKEILSRLAEGKVDIIIGTHRLLSKDVRFKNLGLVIVDEEHRFGVEHKEKLKALKVDTHVLTLTATPIPRTLHMALSGLRDISLINTPPVDRLPIRTFVSKFDESLIQRTIEFELARGGQVFFLHNRVQTIEKMAARIEELVPAARVAIGHGQMPEGALEKTMLGFYQKQTNVLVCTTIIESGLDLPSANTIIISRADAMGLAQLYQIRGRVGRGQERAYAYLLIPAEGAITEDARRRLEVIQRFVELGSGFSIANHDLEIRGGGDLLGPQQSGHIAAVGFDLYTELLEEAIRELQGSTPKPEESRREPEIKVPFPAFLDDKYVPDVHQRLSLYRRFSSAEKEEDIETMEEELVDRFGPLPLEASNLLWLIRIKQILKQAGLDGLTVGKQRISLSPGPHSTLDPARAISLVSGHPDLYQLLPDSRFVASIPAPSPRDLFFSLEDLLRRLRNPC